MKQSRQFFIGLAVAVAALYYTLRNVSFEQLAGSFETLEAAYILPAVAIIALNYVARAYRWRVLLYPVKKVGVSSLYSPLMVGFMGNALPARAGEFLRAYLLGKKHGIPFSGAFATIVVERLFDLLILLFLLAYVSVQHADIFESDFVLSGLTIRDMTLKFGQFCLAVVVAAVLFIYFLIHKKELAVTWVHKLSKPLPDKWRDKIEYLLDEFYRGCLVMKDWGALLKILFYTLLVWATMIYAYYPLYWAYGLENKSLESVLILTLLVAIIITILPTPAFIGSFNMGVLIALHVIMGEPEIKAVSFGMVAWALHILVVFGAGFYFIFHDHLSLKSLIKAKSPPN